MLKHILLVGLLSFSALPLLKAQSCVSSALQEYICKGTIGHRK